MTMDSRTDAAARGSGPCRPSFALRAIGCIVIFFAFTAASPAQARSAHQCEGGKLTLKAVEGYVRRNEDEIAVATIKRCHVAFSLDAPSLERLIHDGIAEPVLQALNTDTVAQLSAAQAHTEVSGLQTNPGDAKVGKAFETRIASLRNAEYAVPGPFTYKDYEKNTQSLTATLGEDEYLFRPVPADVAQKLSSNPTDISILRHFDDDDLQERVLRLPADHIEITGKSKRAMLYQATKLQIAQINDALRQADNTFELRNYDAASAQYAAASHAVDAAEVLNKGNLDATDRQQLATQITAARQKTIDRTTQIAAIIQLASKCKANGLWCQRPDDPKALVWELKDNGADIDAHDAETYCAALRTGNYTDWRLPTVLELQGIFDPNVTRDTQPTAKTYLLMRGKVVEKLPKGTIWQYHIKGGIELTAPQVWSSTPDDAGGQKQAYGDFQDGKDYRRKANNKDPLRALCVRGSSAVVATAANPALISGEKTPAKVAPQQPADTWSDPKTRLMWPLKDNGHKVNWNDARDYCHALRTGGFSDWRLPSRDELRSIFDNSRHPYISDWKRHTRGGIALSDPVIWSGTRDNSTILGEGAVWVKFFDGLYATDSIAQKNRALCVRALPASAEIPSPEPLPNAPGTGSLKPRLDATARMPANQPDRQAEALSLSHQNDQAIPFFHQSCPAALQQSSDDLTALHKREII